MDDIAGLVLREAAPFEADLVAGLHAESWRSAYAGILSADYLTHHLLGDRQAVWRARFAEWPANMTVILAEEAGAAVGFVGIFGAADRRWGTLVDNLHVLPQAKGRGIGRRLLRAAAQWADRRHPGAPLHLWVFADNRPARAFYERMGGTMVEEAWLPNPDGSMTHDMRYAWPDISLLMS